MSYAPQIKLSLLLLIFIDWRVAESRVPNDNDPRGSENKELVKLENITDVSPDKCFF